MSIQQELQDSQPDASTFREYRSDEELCDILGRKLGGAATYEDWADYACSDYAPYYDEFRKRLRVMVKRGWVMKKKDGQYYQGPNWPLDYNP